MPDSPPPPGLIADCETCGAQLRIPEDRRTAECAYCGSPAVVERPPTTDRPVPSFVIGFVLDHDRATARVRQWLRGRSIFARSGLAKAALAKGRGVYVPAWLYGAVAHADYQAEIGEEYTTTETYTTTDSKGNAVTRTRTVTRTEWRSLAGHYSRNILDVVVTASRGISNEALGRIEPFDLRALRRYSSELLAGWEAEEATLDRDASQQAAHVESHAQLGRDLHGFMPGDSHRDLEFGTRLEEEILDLVLLPVWSFAVRYAEDEPPLRVLVNGQTGEVQGRVPRSALKIAAAILLALGLIAYGLLVARGAAP